MKYMSQILYANIGVKSYVRTSTIQQELKKIMGAEKTEYYPQQLWFSLKIYDEYIGIYNQTFIVSQAKINE
jgi:hypothetical protein